MKPQLSIVLLLLPLLTLGQHNLVPNGSFEDNIGCPSITHQWNVDDWNRAVSTPDYFNRCIGPTNEGSFLDVPCNTRGCQDARTGDAYVGLFAFDRQYPERREFIQVYLNNPLVPRCRYRVEFFVCPAEKFGYSVSTLAAALTHQPPNSITINNEDITLEAEPQILNNFGSLSDTIRWIQVTDTLVSLIGGEQVLTIGNFHIDQESDTLHFNPSVPGERAAYYYIDDVSVVAIDTLTSGISGLQDVPTKLKTYPNPVTDMLKFDSEEMVGRITHLEILDVLGRTITIFSNKSGLREVDTSFLPQGTYFINVTNQKGRMFRNAFIKK